MKYFLTKIDNFKSWLSLNIMFLLSYSLKFQISLLTVIAKNTYLYTIYIFLIIYANFSCSGVTQCNNTHVISLMIVLYLEGTCLEIYFLCKVPKTRKWVIKLVGENYFIAYFPNGNELLLKYFVPIFFLLILEILSMILIDSFYFGLNESIYNSYRELYGYDSMIWPNYVKEMFLKDQFNVVHSAYNKGIVSFLGNQISSICNYIVKIITNFF